MKIDIHYCTKWKYEPNAASVAEELHNAFGIKANLIPGGNGIFDIIVDGKLVFSKYETGRFPQQGEVVNSLKQ